MAKQKEKEESRIYYLRAGSLEDVCRLACRFDFTSDTLLLHKSGSENRLISLGERIGETQIAYYASTNESGGIVLYEPATDSGKERMTFTSNTDLPGKYYINVMRADLSKFTSASSIDKKEVQVVKVETLEDLVGAVIRRASGEEKIAGIYAFNLGSRRAFGAFDVIGTLSNSKPVFFYAFGDSGKAGNFARYDYRNNILDFANAMEGHAYVYAKVINLAEPFPFLTDGKK